MVRIGDMDSASLFITYLTPSRYWNQISIYQIFDAQPDNVRALPQVKFHITDVFGFKRYRSEAYLFPYSNEAALVLMGFLWRLFAFIALLCVRSDISIKTVSAAIMSKVGLLFASSKGKAKMNGGMNNHSLLHLQQQQ